jgi:hypothetical protein
MEPLLSKFGLATVPESYKLYTTQSDVFNFSGNEVFFTLHKRQIFNRDKTLFQSITLKELKLIPIYCTINNRTHSSTLLPQLIDVFNDDVPELKIIRESGVTFKKDITSRAPLIQYLKEKGYDGWLSPVEDDKSYMECCIFEPSTTLSQPAKVNKLKRNFKKMITLDILVTKGNLLNGVNFYNQPNGNVIIQPF